MSVTDIPSIDLGEHPQSRTGLLTATIISILWVVAVRIALAPVINDPVNLVSYVGVIGGILGAASMLAVLRWQDLGHSPATQVWARFLANGEGDPIEYVRQGTYLHIVYGAIAGGVYPRLFYLLGIRADLYATLPWSLAIGVAFGLLAFVVAMGLVALNVIEMDVDGRRVGAFLGLHLLYGLMVSAVVGLYGPVFSGVL
jgi:hypothetical protein